MKILIPISLLAFAVISCGGDAAEETDNNTNEADSVAMDTVASPIEIPPMDETLTAICDRTIETKNIPFVIDSIYIEDYVTYESDDPDNLTSEEVKYLTPDFLKNEPTEYSNYTVKTFYRLDSMKNNNTYDDYVNSLDIGMMKDIDAYLCDKIIVNDSTFILLWAISYGSYEACPYSSGTVIFGTYVLNNSVKNVAVVGESSGGGDPPVWGDTFISSEITEEGISCDKIDRFGEEDYETGEEIVEETNNTFLINFSSEGFAVKK